MPGLPGFVGTSWWAAFRGDVWVGLPGWLAAGAKLLPGNLPGRNSAEQKKIVYSSRFVRVILAQGPC